MSSLIVAGDGILALGPSWELFVAEATPEGFEELARDQVIGDKGCTMPALANGLLFHWLTGSEGLDYQGSCRIGRRHRARRGVSGGR